MGHAHAHRANGDTEEIFQRNSTNLCVEKKNQLDVTVCTLLHLYAQNVSGTSMPIIRSSRLHVCICRLWCAVLGCWLSEVRFRADWCASRKRAVSRSATTLFLDAHPATLHLTPDNQQPSTAHHRRKIHTYSLELLMMSIEMPEICWAYHKCNKVHSVISRWFFFSTHMQRCTDRHTLTNLI
jgi:hypothetical protein